MKSLLLILLFFAPILSHGKCLVPAGDIEAISQKILWQGIDGEEQNTALIQGNVSGTISDSEEESFGEGDYEVYVRPDEDGAFQVLPLPLFMVEMKKDRDSVYLCAHFDSKDAAKTEIVMYFLRNNRIKPITPKPLPLMGIKNIFKNRLRRTPLVLIGAPFAIVEKVQEVLTNIWGDLTKLGVDRIRITSTEIQLYSGGDPGQFDSYVLKKVIPLK
ncbi:hypothetical protein [Bdellovibrio svalbardensis]|uniref:Uncharacterized protein n=1 Tax=Bdellovibrio svalbardensis TaxID=2972972 RepID=A0ABT6DKP7_9BACT|nr:hypothetical protein [Bdellovibrio svalbardensis]MDG0817221.1 hypothetical protein [Bdellovibrio svalbardensis]